MKKYEILSPDGFAIERESAYKSIKEAKKAFENWKKRYEAQGYYSSNKGRIDILDLEYYCTLIKL